MNANEVIELFWGLHPDLKRNEYGGHNDQNPTTRTAFSFFIDGLARDGGISEELASNITLSDE